MFENCNTLLGIPTTYRNITKHMFYGRHRFVCNFCF